MAESELTLFLAGDALIVRPWSKIKEPAFLRLVETIRAANVSIVNLETLIHEYKGFAQFDSGGTYMASPPAIAAELKWAGFDMLAHANNHAFDYGSEAILETIEHAESAGLVIAGSGRDLQHARAARYFRAGGGVVGLVSMAASFVRYGQASHSRRDLQGRPGVNPLSLTPREGAFVVSPKVADYIRAFGRRVGRKPQKLKGRSFRVGFRFHIGRRFGIEWARELVEADRLANLAAISEAAANADVVVASIHAHIQGRWLEEFAKDAVEHGADIVFVQGPHKVGAVEFYRGKPIFYSMGDFVYEIESIERLPSAYYERAGLGDDASPRDYMSLARRNPRSQLATRHVFEGFVAVLSIADGRVSRVRLMPVDLQFDAAEENRGRPQIAAPELGERIIGKVAKLSLRRGTRIRYDAAGNFGEVEIPRSSLM